MKKLPVVKANHGIHLRALVPVEEDETGTARNVGDEWQLVGPLTYLPRPEVVRILILCQLISFVLVLRDLPLYKQEVF